MLTGAAFLSSDIGFQIILFLIALATLLFLAHIRIWQQAGIVHVFLGVALFMFILQSLLVPGTTPIPSLESLPTTVEAVRHAGAVSLRMATFIFLTVAFVSTTDPADLGAALHHRLGLPKQVAIIFFMALRIADLFEQELAAMRESAKLRSGGRLRSIRRNGSARFAVLLFVRGLRRANVMVVSLTVRGGAAGGFTGRRQHFTSLDYLCLTASPAVAIVLIFLARN